MAIVRSSTNRCLSFGALSTPRQTHSRMVVARAYGGGGGGLHRRCGAQAAGAEALLCHACSMATRHVARSARPRRTRTAAAACTCACELWRRSRSLVAWGLLRHRWCRTAVQLATPNSELRKQIEDRKEEIQRKDGHLKNLQVRAAAQHTRRPRTFEHSRRRAGRPLQSVAAVRFGHAPRRRPMR